MLTVNCGAYYGVTVNSLQYRVDGTSLRVDAAWRAPFFLAQRQAVRMISAKRGSEPAKSVRSSPRTIKVQMR